MSHSVILRSDSDEESYQEGMLYMNKIQLEDCRSIGSLDCIEWDKLKGASILITGSTGLIGQNLVHALAYNSCEKGLDIRLILPVRDTEAAESMFGRTGAEIFPYELGTDPGAALGKKPGAGAAADYIVHLASPTSSRYFIEKPVDTMRANIEGTGALLEFAKENPVKRFVILSTMEVYGFPEKGHKVTESEIGTFAPTGPRNSYPIAKIASEALCSSYHSQYGVPAVILRAAQTFGPGVRYDDGRVFAQLMRCAVEKKDIVLKSAGLTERSYLYTADAVSAIIVSLLKGVPGEVYNVANPDAYCSIKDMAQMVADEIAGGAISVAYDLAEDTEALGYAGTLYMDLDTEKIRGLGWRPATDLK